MEGAFFFFFRISPLGLPFSYFAGVSMTTLYRQNKLRVSPSLVLIVTNKLNYNAMNGGKNLMCNQLAISHIETYCVAHADNTRKS